MATPPVATKVFLCQAPRRVTPTRLARLTGTRWAIETCFQEGKQLLGLGDYEGRSWQGWHRHMILCMLMHFFLLQGKLALKKQPGLTLSKWRRPWRPSWPCFATCCGTDAPSWRKS